MSEASLGDTMNHSLPQQATKRAADASRSELQVAVSESHDVLMQATSLGLFPDTITLDRAQITITKRTFLRMAETTSMRIEDVLNVAVGVGPIFGHLEFYSRIANVSGGTIGYLRRSDALRLKRIIQGYSIAIQREIDCSNMATEELVRLLEELDETNTPA